MTPEWIVNVLSLISCSQKQHLDMPGDLRELTTLKGMTQAWLGLPPAECRASGPWENTCVSQGVFAAHIGWNLELYWLQVWSKCGPSDGGHICACVTPPQIQMAKNIQKDFICLGERKRTQQKSLLGNSENFSRCCPRLSGSTSMSLQEP